MDDPREGSCLCGAVRVLTKGALRGVIYCHCSQCRKQTGHFYAATDVSDDRLTVRGEENVRWYNSSDFASRGFCGTCGSALFWKRANSDYTSVLAGLFDNPTGLVPDRHIFVADKGDYYTIDDGLPQFSRSTPDIKVQGD